MCSASYAVNFVLPRCVVFEISKNKREKARGGASKRRHNEKIMSNS